MKNDWNVYPNVGTLEPWWKLGNLKQDSLEDIFATYANDMNLALKTLKTQTAKEMAHRYGNWSSAKIYMSKRDLIDLYTERYCKDHIDDA